MAVIEDLLHAFGQMPDARWVEEEDEATAKTGRQDDERRRAEISQLKSLALQSSPELSLRQESSDWGHVSKLLHTFPDRKGQGASGMHEISGKKYQI